MAVWVLTTASLKCHMRLLKKYAQGKNALKHARRRCFKLHHGFGMVCRFKARQIDLTTEL